jgi:hypothetical protein
MIRGAELVAFVASRDLEVSARWARAASSSSATTGSSRTNTERGRRRADRGSRIAWFADPDGNTLSLQQAP